MKYDEGLAERLRDIYSNRGDVVERKMFGGLAFMVSGHMSCGVVGESLMVRVGAERYERALAQPFAREMDFTGRPLGGFVYVSPEGFESDKGLAAWVDRSLEFVTSLEPK